MGGSFQQKTAAILSYVGQGFASNDLIYDLAAASFIQIDRDEETKYKYDLEQKSIDEVGISDAISNMHLLPYSVVKDYAEQDVSLTLKLWNIFKKRIRFKPIMC